MWISLLAVMRKELRQALRDRRMAAILFVVPLLQLVVLGYAVDLDVDRIPAVVSDGDRSPLSREIVREMMADGTFRWAATTSSADAASGALDKGRASVAIIIPAGLEKAVLSNRSSSIQVLVDGSDPNRGQVAAAAATQMVARRSRRLQVELLERRRTLVGAEVSMPMITVDPRPLYNPSLRSATYMVPGVASVVLLVVTTIVTAMGIARERESGTLEQLLVTPLRPATLLLGKCLPFAAIGLFEVFLILTVGTYLFEVPVRGSLLIIAVATSLYLLSTLGVGIFISTVSRTQQQAILGGFFFIMPAILLSGFMTPIENMPAWLQPITFGNPVRFYLEVLRGVLLKNAGWRDVAPQFFALLAFGTLIFAASAARFRKRLA